MRDVIASDSYYSVPDYQRPYEWTAEHIEDFWTDLTKSFERKEGGYFLDKLILVNRGDGKDFEVVDGRQRLTTTIILLAVLRDFFFEHDLPERADEIQNTCIKPGKYRLYVRPEERASFEDRILKSVGVLKDVAKSNLPGIFKTAVVLLTQFIEEKSDELKLKDDEEGIIMYLDEFYHFLLDEVMLIVVTTDSVSSAYTIFEAINTRGKDLETKDLLKNLLIRRIEEEVNRHNTQYPTAQKSFDEEKRRFLDTWLEIEKVKVSTDELLRHHRMAVVGDRSRKDLFREISEDIKDADATTETFMDDWKQSVDAFVELKTGTWHREPFNGSAQKALLLLWNIGHGYWIPVLIAAWRNGVGREETQTLIEGLERFCGLSFVAGHTSRGVLSTLLASIRDLNTRQPIENTLARIESFLKKNRVFRDATENLRSDVYHASWGKYALARYEYTLLDDSVIREIPFSRTVQLEHILPQTMTDPAWTSLFTEDEHDELVNTLGNVTLLAGSMNEGRKSKNQSASNKPFSDKVKIYRGETNKDGMTAFRMTQEVADYEQWTPSIIHERTESILSTFIDAWHVTPEDMSAQQDILTSDFTRSSDSEILTSDDVRFRLEETLERESDLTPRVVVFLKTLLSEDRSFTQEELRANLYDNGIGNDLGQAGRYLSNISQFVTNVNNAHLRAIIAYDTENDQPGARKDNYYIRQEYRDLVRDALAKL